MYQVRSPEVSPTKKSTPTLYEKFLGDLRHPGNEHRRDERGCSRRCQSFPLDVSLAVPGIERHAHRPAGGRHRREGRKSCCRRESGVICTVEDAVLH